MMQMNKIWYCRRLKRTRNQSNRVSQPEGEEITQADRADAAAKFKAMGDEKALQHPKQAGTPTR